MLKVRMQGTVSDMKWFRQLMEKHDEIEVIRASEPKTNRGMLADFLNMEDNITINMHIQSMDQAEAIKLIKGKITDIDRMKIEEQKKAVRSGYDKSYILWLGISVHWTNTDC